MIYFFYPETKGIELEDIPLLFAKGGVTGGVFKAPGGRTVIPGQHAQETDVNRKLSAHVEQVEMA